MRLRSIENVINEIDYLVEKLGTKAIHFYDDNFGFYPERVKELCNNIIKRKYKNLGFRALLGPNFGDLETFRLMAQAKFYSVSIAVESGSQQIRDKLGKVKLDFEELKKTIETAKQAGLIVSVTFICGVPFDTLGSIQKTIDLAKNLSIDGATFTPLIPFVGTKLYMMVKEKGGKFLYDLFTRSVGYDWKPVYELGYLRAKDVEIMIKRAYREFYFEPKQICKLGKNFIKRFKLPSPRIILSVIREIYMILSMGGFLWRKYSYKTRAH